MGVNPAPTVKGAVVRIYLEDFVTYRQVTVAPHPNLNVIVGPNGCGKSTIVSGIVLGLGGNQKVIARGSTIASFIRHGCKRAVIKIELHNGSSGTVTVTRIIHHDNKSTWLIDECTVTLKQVEKLVAGFNIQVSNLCQLLPQDRVCDFAKMNAQTLLENTESSVGSSDLYPAHMKLKELGQLKFEKETKLRDLNTELDSEVEQNERIHISLDSARQKEVMLRKIEKLRVKKAWTVVNLHRMKIETKEFDRKLLQCKYRNLERSLEPFTQRLKSLKREEESLFREICSQKNAKTTKCRALDSHLSQAKGFEDKILRLQQSLEKTKERELTKQKEIKFQEQELEKMESDLEAAMRQPDLVIKEELRVLQAELSDVNAKFGKLQLDEQELETQKTNIGYEIRAKDSELKSLTDRKDSQLRYIAQRYPDVHKALLWIQQNEHRFSAKIYGPLLLELQFEPKNAQYVELIVSYNDLLAFVCEDKQDMNMAMLELRKNMQLRVNFLHSGKEHPGPDHYKSALPLDEIRCFGFTTYLSDLISGPEPVMKYMYRTFKIHNIPIGTRTTDAYIDAIPPVIKAYFSERYRYSVQVSHYSGEKIIQTSEIEPPKLLVDVVDPNAINAAQQGKYALQEQERSLMDQMLRLREDMSKVGGKRKEMLEKKMKVQQVLDRRSTLAVQVKLRRSRLEALRRSCVNLAEEISKCDEAVKNVIREQCAHFVGTSSLYKDFLEFESKTLSLQSTLEDLSKTLQEEQARSVELKRQCDEAEKSLKTAGQVLEGLADQNLKLYRDALQLSDGKAPSEEYIGGLVGPLADIDGEIQDLSVRVDYILDADSQEIAEYKSREVKIAELRKEVDRVESELAEATTDLDALKVRWLPPIRALVDRISANFARCFHEMGCAGEVNLVAGENEDNFEQYGIQIKVKFRAGDELRELTRFLQSGGERSVSTAIYLISLQELAYVPFRCVDEINQGMDPTNERRIFSLLLNATSRTDTTTQYFLLTPKLLDDLEYNRNVMIHFVNNGQVDEKFKAWAIDKFLDSGFRSSDDDQDMEQDE